MDPNYKTRKSSLCFSLLIWFAIGFLTTLLLINLLGCGYSFQHSLSLSPDTVENQQAHQQTKSSETAVTLAAKEDK